MDHKTDAPHESPGRGAALARNTATPVPLRIRAGTAGGNTEPAGFRGLGVGASGRWRQSEGSDGFDVARGFAAGRQCSCDLSGALQS
jgi:hypothetical protein